MVERFRDGEDSGKECPKCETIMLMEMSFMDAFSHTTGHYTIDRPILCCPNVECGYTEDYTPQEEECEVDE